MEWIESQPFIVVALFLTAVAGFRSQLTYLLGRGIRAGLVRAAWAQKLASDKERKAVNQLEKWGWPLIPLSFLTVGFQTAVQLTAGLIGWRWLPYTLSAVPGWILWGVMYAAGGLAAFIGIVTLAQKSWWLAALVILLVAGIIVVLIVRKRKRKARTQVDQEDVVAEDV
jgi:membrane protein DedA with SNARE-associated domain